MSSQFFPKSILSFLPKRNVAHIRLSIRIQLLGLVLIVAVPLIGLLIYSMYKDASDAMTSAGNATLNLAEIASASTEQFLLDSQALLEQLAPRAQSYLINSTMCDSFQNDFVNLSRRYTILELIDASGHPLCSTKRFPNTSLPSVADRAWFQNLLHENKFTISDPLIGRFTGKWSVVLANPLNDANGQIIGALSTSIDLVHYQFVLDSVALSPGTVIAIVDDRGTVIAHSPNAEEFVGQDVRGTEVVDIVLRKAKGWTQAAGSDNVNRIYGFTTIPKIRWHVYAGISTDVILANFRAGLLTDCLMAMIITLIVLMGAFLMSRHIAEPMKILATTAQAVTQGNFEARAPITGPLEVAQVAAEFNQMLVVRSQLDAERKNAEAQLARREELFRAMIENSLDGIVLLSAEGIVTYASPAATRIFGYSKDEDYGKNRTELIHPDDRERADQKWSAILQQPGAISKNEIRIRHKDGSWRWTEHILHNLLLNPAVEAVVSNYHDITERKQSEEALRQYATRLEIRHDIDEAILAAHSLEETSMAVLNRVRNLVTAEEAHITLYNFDENNVSVYARIPRSESDPITRMHIPMEHLGKISDILDVLRQGQVVVTDNLTDRMPDSPIIQMWLAGTHRTVIVAPLREQGQLIGTLSLSAEESVQYSPEEIKIVQEVADSLAIAIVQMRLFEKISAGRYRLRLLSHQLIEAQEDASRRIARELHDEVGTNLSALGINLHVLKSEISGDAAKIMETRLNDSLKLLDETQDRIRSVLTDLHPTVLDDYGLEAALHWYAEQFSDRTGVEVIFHSANLSPRLSSDLETVLFRITQEALSNVAKHAQATRVNIVLEQAEGLIRLSVADDGIGFNLSEHHILSKQSGLGLISMRERAESLGGTLQVISAPGKGTQILVELAAQPISEQV